MDMYGYSCILDGCDDTLESGESMAMNSIKQKVWSILFYSIPSSAFLC